MKQNKEKKAKWEKEEAVRVFVRLNRKKHDHVIRFLETVPNVSEYIRSLIEKDISEMLDGK